MLRRWENEDGMSKADMGINWHSIAEAIREKRYDDIPLDTWNMIADKIDSYNRGRGRPPERDRSRESKLVKVLFKHMKKLAGGTTGMTMLERWLYIEERYNELVDQGRKSSEAIKMISEEKGWSVKTVEAALTTIRADKELIEFYDKQMPFIVTGVLNALNITLDEDGNLISDPDLIDYPK
jgi:hypothetical protein